MDNAIVISVDVEGLVKHVMVKANQCAGDFPIANIEVWIREFFEGK